MLQWKGESHCLHVKAKSESLHSCSMSKRSVRVLTFVCPPRRCQIYVFLTSFTLHSIIEKYHNHMNYDLFVLEPRLDVHVCTRLGEFAQEQSSS